MGNIVSHSISSVELPDRFRCSVDRGFDNHEQINFYPFPQPSPLTPLASQCTKIGAFNPAIHFVLSAMKALESNEASKDIRLNG